MHAGHGVRSPAVKQLLAFQAARARDYYKRADAALPRTDARRLVAARIMGEIYRGILESDRGGRLRRVHRRHPGAASAPGAHRGVHLGENGRDGTMMQEPRPTTHDAFDVAVVGGGVAGLAAATALAEAGRRVLVLEARVNWADAQPRSPTARRASWSTTASTCSSAATTRRSGCCGESAPRPTCASSQRSSCRISIRDGRRSVLRCPPLPSPLHLLAGDSWLGRAAVARAPRGRAAGAGSGTLSNCCASEHRERATRTERAGEAARERACRGVRGAKPLG